MILLQEKLTSSFSPCTYIDGHMWRFEYFFASDLNEEEMKSLLSRGWRKFGFYFFKPSCGDCEKCIPLRVLTEEFEPSKSQRRVLKKGSDIRVKFGPLEFSEEIYSIYVEHSKDRFNQQSNMEDFKNSFYEKSCPAVQSEYYLDGVLFAVGFLDRAENALSSVYFIYKSDYAEFSPGTFSILQEIDYAKSIHLPYYYLGYYIEENHSMAYKNRFSPNEQYNWQEDKWERFPQLKAR